MSCPAPGGARGSSEVRAHVRPGEILRAATPQRGRWRRRAPSERRGPGERNKVQWERRRQVRSLFGASIQIKYSRIEPIPSVKLLEDSPEVAVKGRQEAPTFRADRPHEVSGGSRCCSLKQNKLRERGDCWCDSLGASPQYRRNPLTGTVARPRTVGIYCRIAQRLPERRYSKSLVVFEVAC